MDVMITLYATEAFEYMRRGRRQTEAKLAEAAVKAAEEVLIERYRPGTVSLRILPAMWLAAPQLAQLELAHTHLGPPHVIPARRAAYEAAKAIADLVGIDPNQCGFLSYATKDLFLSRC